MIAVCTCSRPYSVNVLVMLFFQAWSNGRWCNVQHRVQCKQAAVRVSIATFLLGPKEEAVVAPEELVDAEHPRTYVPFTYEDYRKLRISTKLQAGEALALLRADS